MRFTPILFCLLVMMVVRCYGQDYIPFPTNNAYWRYHTEYMDEETSTEFMLFLNGEDSVINGKLCHKLMKRAKTYYTSNYTPHDNIVSGYPDALQGFIREENKVVYYIQYVHPHHAWEESILFDFNLNAGDTMPEVGYGDTGYISSVSSYLINGNVNVPQYNFEIHDYNMNPIYNGFYLEGIGGSWGLLPSGYLPTYGIDVDFISCTFICFHDDNNGFNFNPENLDCNYIYPYGSTAGVNNVTTNNEVSVYPIPFSSQLNIQCESDGDAMLYNAAGQVMVTKHFTAATVCAMNEVVNFPMGMYFLVVRDREGNVLKKEKVSKL